MLADTHDSAIDDGPHRTVGTERLCVATRAVKPIDELIRFVIAPDGSVVPDVKRKLPGRGVWVSADRAALAVAMKHKAFDRSFRREVRVASDLVAVTERLLERAALDALAIAYKSGRVVPGFAKAEAAIEREAVVAIVHAAEASADGVRKLAAATKRRFGGEGGPEVIDLFTSAQLDLALGRPNVVHAALLAGPASDRFLARCRGLERFRSDDRSVREAVARGGKGGW